LDAEEDADHRADTGGDGQDPEVTGNGLGLVSRSGGDSAFERHFGHTDGTALDHHEASVTPQSVPTWGFSFPRVTQRPSARTSCETGRTI
jgi:hypothetical protein